MAVFGDMYDTGDQLTEREEWRLDTLLDSFERPSFNDTEHPLMPSSPRFETEIQARVIDSLDRYGRAAGLNKKEMADYIGVNERTIRNWRGDAHKACSMDSVTCEKFTMRLFTSLDWLRYGTDNMPDGDNWDSSIVAWYYLKADRDTRADVCHALRRGAEIVRLGRKLDNMHEALDPLVTELGRLRKESNT